MSVYLVCGGRDYDNDKELDEVLSIWVKKTDIIIHGNCRGLDKKADAWAKKRGVHTAAVDALWDYYDKPAGPLRNKAMISLRPESCIAFEGGRGTDNMVNLCVESNILVLDFRLSWLVHHESYCVLRGPYENYNDECDRVSPSLARHFVFQGYSITAKDRRLLGVDDNSWMSPEDRELLGV